MTPSMVGLGFLELMADRASPDVTREAFAGLMTLCLAATTARDGWLQEGEFEYAREQTLLVTNLAIGRRLRGILDTVAACDKSKASDAWLGQLGARLLAYGVALLDDDCAAPAAADVFGIVAWRMGRDVDLRSQAISLLKLTLRSIGREDEIADYYDEDETEAEPAGAMPLLAGTIERDRLSLV